MDEWVKGYFRDNYVRSNKRICLSDIISKLILVRKIRIVLIIFKIKLWIFIGKNNISNGRSVSDLIL